MASLAGNLAGCGPAGSEPARAVCVGIASLSWRCAWIGQVAAAVHVCWRLLRHHCLLRVLPLSSGSAWWQLPTSSSAPSACLALGPCHMLVVLLSHAALTLGNAREGTAEQRGSGTAEDNLVFAASATADGGGSQRPVMEGILQQLRAWCYGNDMAAALQEAAAAPAAPQGHRGADGRIRSVSG